MNKILRQLGAFFLLAGGLFLAQAALSQGFGLDEVNNGLGGTLATGDPRALAARIINIGLGFLGIVALGLVMYAGFLWMSSAGNEEKVESAKKILRNAVIGLVIILSSWAIASYLINKIADQGNGNAGFGCYEGELASCGCGGSMSCSGGSFGACIGSDCSNGSLVPTGCDASPNPGCQAAAQICAGGSYCDASDCGCKPQGGLGDSCDANTANATCDADNNRCSEFLTCSPDSCTCVGSPVITSISPAGGFCASDVNKSCASDADCGAGACNLTAPNGTANNLITISGKNFGAYDPAASQVVFAGLTASAAVKNGNQYATAVRGCNMSESGNKTASCSNGYWDYQFNAPQAGAYQLWLETTNSGSSIYGDLDAFQPASGGENAKCPAAGVQHHVNVYLDGALQGSFCSAAVAPNKTKQLGSVNMANVAAGTHTVRVEWDNDWTYNPDGVWNTGDDADSNLTIYRVGFVSTDLAVGVPPSALNSACINTWQDDQIVIAIPAGARSGPIIVLNSEQQADATNDDYGPALPDFQSNNIARPGLCRLSPQAGALSSRVGYQGVNLFSSQAYFGNYQSNVAALDSQFVNSAGLSGTSTTPNIRPGDSGSFVQNTLNGRPEKSNFLRFTKQTEPGSGPFISGFAPARGAAGQYVTIRGKGFGGARGLNRVYFGNLEAAYDFPDLCLNSVWQDDQIIVKVPSGLSDGAQNIQVKIGTTTIDTQKLNPNSFQADSSLPLAASLCKIEPERGPAATPVTLWGEYFGNQNSEGLAKFNVDQSATGTIKKDGRADMIKTAVPLEAVSGPVKVVKNSLGGNELAFQVGICTADADCGTQVCCPANTYKEGRCANALADCSFGIPTSVFEWKFSTGFGSGDCVGNDCENNDPCAAFADAASCGQQTACCFDSRATENAGDDVCRSGGAISSGPDQGYCAYYNCDAADATKCAASDPLKIGAYKSQSACASACVQDNPCETLTTAATCGQNSRCCFDANKTVDTADDVCRPGAGSIASGPDQGYCAYYNCDAANPLICAAEAPLKLGTYDSVYSCERFCANPPGGAGLSCSGGEATTTCATSKCSYPSMGCYTALGQLGAAGPDCGTCCCQPGTTDPLTGWKCLADKGNCTGASRGLFCGCASDNECGSSATSGCGSDTCCSARPSVTGTSPAHLADRVCRNAAVTVGFDQAMNIASFGDNVLLLEERDYDSGVCPAGTFITRGDSLSEILAQRDKNWLARIWDKLTLAVTRLSGAWNGESLAALPDPNKLYCARPGTVSGVSGGDSATLSFSPQSLLAGDTNYYLIIKGDEELNSKTGVLSASGVGLNGAGYLDLGAAAATEGELISFNTSRYKNSHIIKFRTLSAQGASAGICAIDKIKVSPDSYLFKTTENDLNEKDDDARATNATFDVAADRDKVFSAAAYSFDDQVLQPVTGYFWDWRFQVADPAIASLSVVNHLPSDKIVATAQAGVTDGSTKITATVDMSRFTGSTCAGGSCSCTGANCSNNCCNAYSGGDGFNESADLFVFLCNNPWPPVAPSGSWSPWTDTCQNAIGVPCANYNYKFYYCRDAGAGGTLDDLPAILSGAVIRGASSNYVCSADRSACSSLSDAGNPATFCGPDSNGDGRRDGLCVWNVLKESYFFREPILSGGEMISAVDQRTGGSVQVNWRSNASQVAFYKIYYLPAGQGAMLSKSVKASDVCTTAGAVNTCQAVISGLVSGRAYAFKISVISLNKTESQLSNELIATPTDKTPPSVPTRLEGEIPAAATSTLRFSWRPGAEKAVTYRLYHGTAAGRYGESFDSAPDGTSLSFPLTKFAAGIAHYFALSALDASGNESGKSAELSCLDGECAAVDAPPGGGGGGGGGGNEAF